MFLGPEWPSFSSQKWHLHFRCWDRVIVVTKMIFRVKQSLALIYIFSNGFNVPLQYVCQSIKDVKFWNHIRCIHNSFENMIDIGQNKTLEIVGVEGSGIKDSNLRQLNRNALNVSWSRMTYISKPEMALIQCATSICLSIYQRRQTLESHSLHP